MIRGRGCGPCGSCWISAVFRLPRATIAKESHMEERRWTSGRRVRTKRRWIVGSVHAVVPLSSAQATIGHLADVHASRSPHNDSGNDANEGLCAKNWGDLRPLNEPARSEEHTSELQSRPHL